MNRLFAACTAFVTLLCGYARGEGDPAGPSKDVPELEVLSHYAGSWRSEMTMKPSPGLPNGARATGAASAEWIHDGRFLRQTWASQGGEGLPAMNGSTVMTFDPTKKIYRSFSFTSRGLMAESQGTWDARARTMTWTMRNDGGGATSVTKATFPKSGVESWSIVEKDVDGKILADVSGKNWRQAK